MNINEAYTKGFSAALESLGISKHAGSGFAMIDGLKKSGLGFKPSSSPALAKSIPSAPKVSGPSSASGPSTGSSNMWSSLGGRIQSAGQQWARGG